MLMITNIRSKIDSKFSGPKNMITHLRPTHLIDTFLESVAKSQHPDVHDSSIAKKAASEESHSNIQDNLVANESSKESHSCKLAS